MRLLVLICSIICISETIWSQVQDYSDSTGIYIGTQSAMFGNGLSAFDFNEDSLDDLTIAENGSGISMYASSGNGSFTLINYLVLPADIKQVTWIDFDNDNDADLFATTNGNGIFLYENTGDLTLVLRTDLFQEYSDLFAYGASWCDYDKDGWMDLFVCVYNYWGESYWPNLLFHNQQGSFVEIGTEMGVSSWVNNSFQSVWTDFDNDGWHDLYIINDHSVGNEYYRNINGVAFENLSSSNGSGVMQSSMCNSPCDYDRDGDFDVFVSDGGIQTLLENENGMFTNVSSSTAVDVLTFGWGGLWIDYNKDGWEDLHLCTDEYMLNNNWNYFFSNQQGEGFIQDNFDTYEVSSFSSVRGDFNNDRLPDFAVYNGFPATLNLWMNKFVSGNHTAKFRLQGAVSDQYGIGASLHVFQNGLETAYQILGGENYIGQNATNIIVGCGENLLLDSVRVNWPSGWTDTYYNLNADADYFLLEGETFNVPVASPQNFYLCAGDTCWVEMGDSNFAGEVIWSNGQTGDSAFFLTSGEYIAQITNNFGITYEHTFNIVMHDVSTYSLELFPATCHDSYDGACIIHSEDFVLVDDLPFESHHTVADLGHGMHENVLIDSHGCEQQISYEIQAPEPLHLNTPFIALCPDSDFPEVSVAGGSAPYFISYESMQEPLISGFYTLQVQDANGCEDSLNLEIMIFSPTSFSVLTDTVCHGQMSGWEIVMENDNEIVSALVEGDSLGMLPPGVHHVLVTDQHGCQYGSEFEVHVFDSLDWYYELELPANGQPGHIEIQTENNTAEVSYYWSDSSSGSLLEFTEAAVYTCEITDENGCTYYFLIDLSTLSDQSSLPVSDRHRISLLEDRLEIFAPVRGQMSIYDTSGKRVEFIELFPGIQTLDFQEHPSGVYMGQAGPDLVRFYLPRDR